MLHGLLQGAGHLQNIHPLAVHFPIAFLAGSAFFYFAAWIFRRNSLATIAFAMLIVGAISAAVAVVTGLYAQDGVMVSRSVREALLVRHRNLMLAASILSWVLTSWAILARSFPSKGRIVFLFIFLGLLGVLFYGADYGGRMVYDYNAGGSACPQPIDFTR
jgi:uncharacterized membrane protein